MSTLPTRTHEAPKTARAVPRLQSGDRLPRSEFERRYRALPSVRKAELIEGEVHVPSPVGVEHGDSHARALLWVGTYAAATPGTSFSADTSVHLDRVNVVQPDIHLRILPENGGQSRLSDGFVEGAPELVVEIAASSVSIDLHRKRDAYERNGVREYVVWRVDDAAVDWLVLVDDTFRPIAPDASGIVRSTVFPGLWLDAAALVRDDLTRVLAVAQEGIASPEHAALVAGLKARGAQGT